MVAPLVAGIGAGLSVLGGILGNKNAKKVAKNQQTEADNFNRLNAAEFDKRNWAVTQAGSRTNTLLDEGTEALRSTRGGAFDSFIKNRDKGVADSVGVTGKYAGKRAGVETSFSGLGRDMGKGYADEAKASDVGFAGRRGGMNEGHFAKLGQIGADQDAGFERGFNLLGQRNQAERARAVGTFQEGAAALGDTFGKLNVDTFTGDMNGANAARQRALNYAGSGSGAVAVPGATGKFAEALGAKTAAGAATGRTFGNALGANASYTDAASRGVERLESLGSRLDVLDAKAKMSRDAYQAESAAAKNIIESADASAEERREAAAMDIESFLGVLADEQARDQEIRRSDESRAFSDLDARRTREIGLVDDAETREAKLVGDVNQQESDADVKFYDDLAASLMEMYEGLTANEAKLLARKIAASEGRVATEQALTQFKIGNTRGTPSLLSSALSGAGQGLMSAGLGRI